MVEAKRDGGGDRDRDDEVVTRLQIVVVDEEREVATDPEQQCRKERLGEESRAPEEGERQDDEESWIEDVAHPHSVADGVEDDGGKRLELGAGVSVGGEEITVVLEIVRMDEADEVDEPECDAESCGRNREPKEARNAIAGSGPRHVEDCRHEADAGGLGEDDAGNEDGERECEGEGAEGVACA